MVVYIKCVHFYETDFIIINAKLRQKNKHQFIIKLIVAYGKSHWIADGFCDDINNNEACNYDGGDCCGSSIQKHFCIDCECICKFNRFSIIDNCLN